MKIKYHQQHNKRRTFSQLILIGILILVILVLTSFTDRLIYFSKVLYGTVLVGTDSISNISKTTQGALMPKSKLLKENQKLRTEIQKLTTIDLYNQALTIENNKLKALLRAPFQKKHKETTEVTLARIIDYKSSLYGSILLKAQLPNSTIKIGDIARFGGLAVGKVVKIDGDYILVKLFTASDDSYDVLVGDIPAILIGASNGSGKIMLSRTKDILPGTAVSLPYANGYIIGFVEKIERNEEKSRQILYIQTPIPIKDIHFLSINHE